MTISTLDESQRKAAKVVGFTYLFALPPAIFAEFFARGPLIVSSDAAPTGDERIGSFRNRPRRAGRTGPRR